MDRFRRELAFTLIELLVVMAVISLLVGIIVPSMLAAQNIAATGRCMGNLHALVVANTQYAALNDDMLPGENGLVDTAHWDKSNPASAIALPITGGLLSKGAYGGDERSWLCSEADKKATGGVLFNYHYTYNPRTFLLSEKSSETTYSTTNFVYYKGAGSNEDYYGMRRVRTFPGAESTILLGEQNTRSSLGAVITGPVMGAADFIQGRHSQNTGIVGFLDGHANKVPGSGSTTPAVLWSNTNYWPGAAGCR